MKESNFVFTRTNNQINVYEVKKLLTRLQVFFKLIFFIIKMKNSSEHVIKNVQQSLKLYRNCKK